MSDIMSLYYRVWYSRQRSQRQKAVQPVEERFIPPFRCRICLNPYEKVCHLDSIERRTLRPRHPYGVLTPSSLDEIETWQRSTVLILFWLRSALPCTLNHIHTPTSSAISEKVRGWTYGQFLMYRAHIRQGVSIDSRKDFSMLRCHLFTSSTSIFYRRGMGRLSAVGQTWAAWRLLIWLLGPCP